MDTPSKIRAVSVFEFAAVFVCAELCCCRPNLAMANNYQRYYYILFISYLYMSARLHIAIDTCHSLLVVMQALALLIATIAVMCVTVAVAKNNATTHLVTHHTQPVLHY